MIFNEDAVWWTAEKWRVIMEPEAIVLSDMLSTLEKEDYNIIMDYIKLLSETRKKERAIKTIYDNNGIYSYVNEVRNRDWREMCDPRDREKWSSFEFHLSLFYCKKLSYNMKESPKNSCKIMTNIIKWYLRLTNNTNNTENKNNNNKISRKYRK